MTTKFDPVQCSRFKNLAIVTIAMLSRRARARWACVSSSPVEEEETQAQRARARRRSRRDKLLCAVSFN